LSSDPLAGLATALGGSLKVGPKSTVLEVEPTKVAAACLGVKSLPGMYHLSTITGVDSGDSIALLYHFWLGTRFFVVATAVPKTSCRVESISKAIPSASLYEAEIQDLLGVTFEGNPYVGRRLLLPDDYPAEAPPPLRKEADPEKIRKMMGLE
jgi:F420H2:quinone oxidoreductase subunit B/C